MPQVTTEDGRYLFVIDDPTDGNSVVYDARSMTALWDRLSYEANHSTPTVPAEPTSPPPTTVPGLIRVTNESDGDFINRQYSYWPTAYLQDDTAYVFVGHADGHPRFFAVNLRSGAVARMGPQLPYWGTSEGWYWDAEGWIYLTDGPALRRVSPFTKEDRVIFDISESHPGCRLWQAHSSENGKTHSATVQQITSDGPYLNAGTVVFRNGQQEYFPAVGNLDESQITSDGGFVVIKESNYNRIIELATRVTRWLKDSDGAVGHSDVGPSFMVGEDDQHGECVYWDLTLPLTPDRRRTLLKTWNLGHVSIRAGRCLVSDSTMLSLAALDGSGVTYLIRHGMVSDGTYDTQVFGSLDPTGRVATFLSNKEGRMDAYLLVL